MRLLKMCGRVFKLQRNAPETLEEVMNQPIVDVVEREATASEIRKLEQEGVRVV
jgi:hypothetical protein